MANDMDRVVALDELDDFRIADGDPDVRGWDVIGADGRRIGEVDELLIDVEAMKVRYLDVDLDEAVIAAGENRHILIPIGYARLDDRMDRIFVDELDSAGAARLPEYDHQPLTRDWESALRTSLDASFGVEPGAAVPDADYYAHAHYDEVRFYAGRRGGTVSGSGATDDPVLPGGRDAR